MERLNTTIKALGTFTLAILLFSGCAKTAAEPEIQGPKETIILALVDNSNKEVGALYIDDMNGRAQARIALHSGYYTAGEKMKANVTLTAGGNTALYAHCTDVDGNTGKCSTFPIRVLADNSDASFSGITATQGIVFNIMDRSNNVVARSTRHTIVINN